MFAAAGHLYVYRSYGIHWCANVVTGAEGDGAAVLIRAVEPTHGVAAMQVSRPGVRRDVDLTSGPGRLSQALGITGADDGLDLFEPHSRVRVRGHRGPSAPVLVSGRIGIRLDQERPWRFWLEGDRYVSAHRRGVPWAP